MVADTGAGILSLRHGKQLQFSEFKRTLTDQKLNRKGHRFTWFWQIKASLENSARWAGAAPTARLLMLRTTAAKPLATLAVR